MYNTMKGHPLIDSSPKLSDKAMVVVAHQCHAWLAIPRKDRSRTKHGRDEKSDAYDCHCGNCIELPAGKHPSKCKACREQGITAPAEYDDSKESQRARQYLVDMTNRKMKYNVYNAIIDGDVVISTSSAKLDALPLNWNDVVLEKYKTEKKPSRESTIF